MEEIKTMEMNEQPQSAPPPTPDSTPGAAPEGASAGQDAGKDSVQQMMGELSNLVNRFGEVLQAAWQSDDRKRVEGELRTGLNSLAESVDKAVQDIKASDETKDIQHKVGDLGEKVAKSSIVQDIAGIFASAAKAVSEQMAKVATDIEARAAADKAARGAAPEAPADSASAGDEGPESKDIPVGKA
jgi:chaperonin cofactor prefoldin